MPHLFESFIESQESFEPGFDEKGIGLALEIAESARVKGDHTVGAVIAWPQRHLKEHDTTKTTENPLNEAGLNVLNKALSVMPHKVKSAVMYCTVEPDALTVLMAHKAGINEVVFGAYNHKDGFVTSKRKLNLEYYDLSFKGGVLADKCFNLLPKSFQEYCSINGTL